MNHNKVENFGVAAYLLPLLFGVGITLVVAWALNYQNEHDVKVYTNTLADKAESLIEERFQHFEYGLRGARGAIVAVGINDITRKQFEKYSGTRDVGLEFPGALGFGFIRRVSVEQENDFLNRARKDGAPNFTIRALAPHDSDRFVIQYIFPVKENGQAVGLDIASEANRREAAIFAARDDSPYLTAPITLVQANKKPRRGALIMLPIYSNGADLTTPRARENAVLGWSYAPLVIDDVLADLGYSTEQASIRLSNLSESEAFYHSLDTAARDLSKQKVIRNIVVLGQHWKMEITPTTQALERVKRWSVGWIIVFGLGLTLCCLLIITVLRTNHQSDDDQNTETYQVGLQSIVTFLKSSRIKRSYLFILLIITLILFVSSWLIIQSHLDEARSHLLQTRASILSKLNYEATKYRRDILFFASSSPMQALKHRQADGIQLEENASLLQLQDERLTDVFKAYMLSHQNVYQVRFIGANNGWQERVKVQRISDNIEAVNKEYLQSKKKELYIDRTLQVGANNVYESDISLNREFGKIEQPNHPVWRFSTTLFNADGSPLGIVIINVSANDLLKASIADAPRDTEVYITNKNGDFLLHPNLSRAFTYEYGNPHRWQDEFKAIDLFNRLNFFGLASFQGEQGSVFAAQGSISLNGDPSGRVINIYTTISQFSVLKKITFQIVSVIIVLLLVSLISIIVQYWVWLTERIRQRDALNTQIENQRNKEMIRFKGLLDSAPDATFVVDEAGTIQVVNIQSEQMFGYDRIDLEGQLIYKLLPSDLRQILQAHIMGYIQNTKTMDDNKELLALRADGSEFPVEISLSAVHLDEKILVSVSVRNISERLAIEEELRSALRDAELATQAKSAFLANTSHEIRTPLNAIIGLGYLLAEEKLTQAQHQLVSKIQISGKSLLGIVNDVLDLSKIEANEMDLETQPVELRELCEEVSSVFAIQAEAKKLEFHFELDPKLPSWVITDSTRLRQILVNLLSNSLKFTTIGKISISAKVADTEQVLPENHLNVRFIVTDTGIGISPEAQARLFKPFTQADTSTTRRFGGTGLGLSIVNQLVQLMGGSVGIESAENEGSAFSVDLPLRVQTSEEIAVQENQNQTIFVLIAEDDPADAKQLQKMTRALGWRSEIVSNGAELVESYLLRQQNTLRPPDAMIVDWQMPLMDGLDAISALASKVGRENIPAVLMVSAHDRDEITKHDTEHYVNNFLRKPVDASSLFNAVNDVVTLSTGNSKRVLQSTRAEAIGAKWLPDMRLLVVDDSPTNLIVVSSLLKQSGALVETANSGEEALILLEDLSNDFDAVLMDVQMPGIDGLETTARIRNNLGLTSLPIIALTAGALVEEKNRALQAGMNDFLTKPIDPSKLINVLRTLVEAYRGKEIAIGSLHSIEPDLSDEKDTWPVMTGLNLDKAKTLLLGDKTLFLETLDGLLLEYANLALPLEHDIDAPDSMPLRLKIASQVHKLRSVSGMVGAEKIQQLSSEAEQTLRSEGDVAKPVLVKLSLALQELQQTSAQVLEVWRKEKLDTLVSKGEASKLQLETLTYILTLLEEQDLNALDEVDEHSASLLESLGSESFQQLQGSLAKLDYKQAIALLGPLTKTLGAT